MNNKWIKPIRISNNGTVDLICFPFAGAGASIFYPWEKLLHPNINLYGFQAPGREDRIGENIITDLKELTNQACNELSKVLKNPFVLFGHSLGAVIAFEIAKKLADSGINPKFLIVSGRQPPHLRLRMPHISDLDDDALIDGLLKLQGTDPEILEHPTLLELFLPIIRGDFMIGERYRSEPSDSKLNCPIIAILTADDHWVNHAEIQEWAIFTTKSFAIETFPGDHFYVKNAYKPLTNFLNKKLLEI